MIRQLFYVLIVLGLIATPAISLAQGNGTKPVKPTHNTSHPVTIPSAPAPSADDSDSNATPVVPTVSEETLPPDVKTLTSSFGFDLKLTQDRIFKLPQDSQKFFTTVIGDPGDSKFEAIKTWFTDVPELAKLKGETHFNAIATNRPDYKDKFAKNVPHVPLIRVQTASGGVVYQVSGDNVPMTGQALARAINTEFLRRWRERNSDRRNDQKDDKDQVDNGNDKDKDDSAVDDSDDRDDDMPADTDKGDKADKKHDAIPDTQPAFVTNLSDTEVLLLAAAAGFILIGGVTLVSQIKAKRKNGF